MIMDWNIHGRIARKRLYICVGTPLVTGDAFGPMVGNLLIANNITNVLGTVKEPIHWKNLDKYTDMINSDEYFKIGIDVAINGTNSNYLKINDAPFKPGLGVGKEAEAIGDISCLYSIGMKDATRSVRDTLRDYDLDELTEYTVFLSHAILRAEQEIEKVTSKNGRNI